MDYWNTSLILIAFLRMKRVFRNYKNANLSVEYTYDGNGNLTSDANKGISLIEYDDMNMPRRIQFANGKKEKINEFILCFALVFVPL